MALKYPHARLMVYSKLAPGEDCCLQAIVQTAAELGIISPGALSDLAVPDTSGCSLMFAGRQVIGQFCRERFIDGKVSQGVMCEQLWSKIEKAVEKHKQETASAYKKRTRIDPSRIDCAQLAPVVIDIMLQHLTPYL